MYEIRCLTFPQINYTMHGSHGWLRREMFLPVSCLKQTLREGKNESNNFLQSFRDCMHYQNHFMSYSYLIKLIGKNKIKYKDHVKAMFQCLCF